jgi:carbamoylphosphate synthase large subunit
LAIAFLKAGCRVSAICPSGHPLRFVFGVHAIHPYYRLDSIGSLRTALQAATPDIIVPCDDGSGLQLHALHQAEPMFRPLIERSLGAPEGYPILESRSLTLQVASELGIRIPATWAIDSIEGLYAPDIEWPAMLKIDDTWGGEGVVPVASRQQAAEVFPSLNGVRHSVIAWKKFLANRHPLALWLLSRRHGTLVTLQKLVIGREATTMFACRDGEILASVTVEVLASQRPAGAATVLRLVRNDEIERASCLMARRLRLNGFHGLDFIIEEGTDAPYLIEMNPRATQLGHLNVNPEGNLAEVLVASFANRPTTGLPVSSPIENTVIALFPNAWKIDPGSQFLVTGYHDVPWDQPELVRELLRKPWPDRRLLHRILSVLKLRRRATRNKLTRPAREPRADDG